MRKIFLAVLCVFTMVSFCYAEDLVSDDNQENSAVVQDNNIEFAEPMPNADVQANTGSDEALDAEYKAKLQALEQQNAPNVPEQPKISEEEFLRQQEILKKQAELRFVFSPKQDKQGNPVVPFIMPQGQVIQIPYVSHIPYFFSYVELFYDGKMMVNETVDMVFASGAYRNQFVRELDTSYTTRTGEVRDLDIVVKSVKMNKDEVPFYVTNYGGKMQVRVLPPKGKFEDGVSTFYVNYVVDGSVFFTPDFDDVFLNIIGNGFDIPIARAGMSVIFPKAPVIRAKGEIIGSENNPNIAMKMERDDEGNIAFAIADPLLPGDDFSVFLTIDKGVLVAPTASEAISKFVRKYALGATALLGLIVILIRYLLAFYEAKKMAKNGVKITNFASYVSAGLMYFNLKRKLDNKSFAAAIMAMAGKDAFSIEKTKEGEIKLIKGDNRLLSLEERVLFNTLFPCKKTEISMDNAKVVKKAFSRFKLILCKRNFIEKLKADKENVIASMVFVFLISAFIGVQTYNYVITTIVSLILTLSVSVLVHSIKSFATAKTLNMFTGKGGKKRLLGNSIYLIVSLVLALFMVYVVRGFTSLSCTISLAIIGYVVAAFPYILREKRYDKKVFDAVQYKEYLTNLFDTEMDNEKAIMLYNRNFASAMVVDSFDDFSKKFTAKVGKEYQYDWYVSDEKSENCVGELYKEMTEKLTLALN